MTVGGKATENRCLLRLIFLFIADKVPEDSATCHALLDLKDIVEICHAPIISES